MYQNFSNGHGGSTGSFHGARSHSPSHNNYTPPQSNTSPSSSGDIMSRMNEREALALLQHLGQQDLEHLMSNDSKLQDLINDLPVIKSIQQDHDNLIATNKSLAEYNLSLQPRMDDLKQYVATEYETINTLKTDLAKDKAKLDTFVGRRKLDTLLALVQTETAKVEEESEELAEKFCSQDVDVEEFTNAYLPMRTLAHTRRIKSERLAEMLRDMQCRGTGQPTPTGASGSSWGPTPPSRPPYPPNTGQTPPYPTGNFGMPQPNMFPR